jgi:hypothetical protein
MKSLATFFTAALVLFTLAQAAAQPARSAEAAAKVVRTLAE